MCRQYVWKNQKKLRTGYTTGSCAAGAAKAAAYMLLGGERLEQVRLETPKGITLYLEVLEICAGHNFVSCAIQKDSGDDPDVTNGVYVYAAVEKTAGEGITIKAGTGIGIVTRKGLEQSVGQPAINQVPRNMIREAVREVCCKYRYSKGITVTVSIPDGVRLAEKTFNPRLGIEGGISVLGTTGIVEPMSEKALIDTIYVEMKMLKENGYDFCYVVPGNYGSDFLTQTLGYEGALAVKCSNYIGEAIDLAVRLEMKGILLIGHIGKVIKLAAGIMNTHSRQADGRLEVLAAHAAMAGGSRELVCKLMNCITTTEAIELLEQEQLLVLVMNTIMEKITQHLMHRSGAALEIGVIMFSVEQGILGSTQNTEKLWNEIRREKDNV